MSPPEQAGLQAGSCFGVRWVLAAVPAALGLGQDVCPRKGLPCRVRADNWDVASPGA